MLRGCALSTVSVAQIVIETVHAWRLRGCGCPSLCCCTDDAAISGFRRSIRVGRWWDAQPAAGQLHSETPVYRYTTVLSYCRYSPVKYLWFAPAPAVDRMVRCKEGECVSKRGTLIVTLLDLPEKTKNHNETVQIIENINGAEDPVRLSAL